MHIAQRPLPDAANLRITYIECDPGDVVKLHVAGHELRLWALFSAPARGGDHDSQD